VLRTGELGKWGRFAILGNLRFAAVPPFNHVPFSTVPGVALMVERPVALMVERPDAEE
jgi:hypothetical protein